MNIKRIIPLFICILFALPSWGQKLTKKQLVARTISERFVDGELKYDMKEDTLQAWNDLFNEQHLKRDRYKHRIDYQSLFPIKKNRIHHIEGKRTYYNLLTKKYRYRVIEDKDQNRLIANIKIHFKVSNGYKKLLEKQPEGLLDEEGILNKFQDQLSKAEVHWNQQAPQGIAFQFQWEGNPALADYRIKISTTFGAIYDSFIYYNFDSDTLTHEIGHMLGLDDEYSFITSNVIPYHELKWSNRENVHEYVTLKDMRCNLESLMCLRDTIYPYYFNHIFGRMKLN